MDVEYKVSVILLAYNHEKTIVTAIESILNQNIDFNVQILIGDDCSSDNTPELIEEYAKTNSNIVFVRRKENLGATENFCDLIGRCSGEYIAALEGDDYWFDFDKLRKQVSFLDANAEYFMCGGKHQCVNENNVPIRHKLRWIKNAHTFSFAQFNGIKLPCHPNTYMFRRTVIEDVEELRNIHRNIADRSLTAMLLFHGKCYIFEDVMLNYRYIQADGANNLTSVLYNGQEMHFYTDYIIAKSLRDFFRRKYNINPSFKLLIPRIVVKSFLKLCIKPNSKRLECFKLIMKDITANER